MKETVQIKFQHQEEVREGELTEPDVDQWLCLLPVINCADQVQHKTEKIKIIVKGAEKFLEMKDLSREQISRRLEEEPTQSSWKQDWDFMVILQWNTKSLTAKGREFKGFIKGLRNKPQMIFI